MHPWVALARVLATALCLQFLAGLPLWAANEPVLEPIGDDFLVKVWESDLAELPHHSFTSIAQTHEGYLWLGTFRNISRFDGERFTVYDAKNQPALPSSMVFDLLVDRSNNLWVATMDGPTVRRPGLPDRFDPIPGWPGGRCRGFAQDRDGTIWTCTVNSILRWTKDRFVTVPQPDRGTDRTDVSLVSDISGTLYVFSQGYLASWDGKAWHAIPPPNPSLPILDVAPGATGGLWIADTAEVVRFESGNWTTRLRRPRPFVNEVVKLMEDSRGNLWCGGYNQGIVVWMRDGRILRCTAAEGLGNNATLSLLEDRDGQIWVGSNGGGLARLRPKSARSFDDRAQIPQNIVNTLCETGPGQLLVGTHGGGFATFAQGRFGPWQCPAQLVEGNPKPLGEGCWVHCILRDSRGTTWIGSYSEGLVRIQQGRAERLPDETIGSQNTHALFEDRTNTLWIGTSAGLVSFDGSRFVKFNTNSGLPAIDVRSIGQDSAGTLWVTDSDHCYRWKTAAKFELYTPPGGGIFEPACFLQDPRGDFWIGSYNRRLLRFRGDTVTEFNASNGMPAENVNSLLVDDDAMLWIGSGEGLVRIPLASFDQVESGRSPRLECLILDKEDGLRTSVCRDGYQPLALKDTTGQLWFATVKGLLRVDPKSVPARVRPPDVFIEAISSDGLALPLARAGAPPVAVPAGSRRVQIRYTALSFPSPEKIRFEHQIVGKDRDWVAAGTDRVAHLQDLRPGYYEFRVRAITKDGRISPTHATISFHVIPFFWQTTWFGILSALTVLLSITGASWIVHSTRTKRLLEQHEHAAKLAEEHAQALALARSKEILAEERNLLRTLIDNLPEHVFVLNNRGEFVLANLTFARAHGVDPESLTGTRASSLPPAPAPSSPSPEELAALTRGEAILDREESPSGPDGKARSILTSKLPLRDRQNVIIGIVGLGVDITDRKRLEDQLQQATKMEAVGQLAGGVAHDFNNILTVLQGHLAFLIDDPTQSASARESITELRHAAERAANLTQQLLAFSRRQILRRKPLDLNDAFTDLCKMLGRVLGEHIKLEFKYSPEPVFVEADSAMLSQIVLNLAVNARDAMPNGGRLTLGVTVMVTDEHHTRGNPEAQPGRHARIHVTDTGEGMDAETRARIFEPFFTTKALGKGTGLGLATVYGIVKQHRGWIEVISAPGKGTTFSIYLPICDPPQPQDRPAETEVAIRGGHETVLVVEDETPVRLLAVRFLRRYGYRVMDASDGPEALRLWQSVSATVDLVVTDMVMPGGIGGKELAAELRKQKPSLKVLYVSGYSIALVSGELNQGASDLYLAKPYEPAELARAARRLLDS